MKLGKTVAFDFDNTITREEAGRPVGWNRKMILRLRRHAAAGDTILIATARTGFEEDQRLSAAGVSRVGHWPLVHASIDALGLPVDGVLFTSGCLKGPFLHELNVALLYDDSPEQRLSAVEHGITAVSPPFP